MRRIFFIIVWLACTTTLLHAVDPIPESRQAPLALKILDADHRAYASAQPKKLHLIYFTPADRAPEPRYQERLTAIMEDIQAFYRDGMKQSGFGPETFGLARDAQDRLIIHLAKGAEPESAYAKPDSEKVLAACRPVLNAAGISLDHETVLIFCNLANWNEKAKTFSHHSPYYGMWTQTNGLCFAVDSVIQNLDDIPKKEPILTDDEYGLMSLGKFNTIFIGGIAHELGHALTLPHCGERRDEKSRGISLMGEGNHTYRNERRGDQPESFLTFASAMTLAGRPLFNQSDQNLNQSVKFAVTDFQLSTNVSRPELAQRPGAFRVSGVVQATPPVYGVIAYFDSKRDGGYHAPTATSVPDADGRFAIEISDLESTRGGELRLEYCHVNGAVTKTQFPFRVTPNGAVDLQNWEIANLLEPLIKAINQKDAVAARAELARLEAISAPELAKAIARNLVATLGNEPKPTPADAPPTVTELPLGNARAQSAKVGWLQPAANRIPASDQVESPVLDTGTLHATGLFAHAPSRYVYDLGGKWQTLRGAAGIHTAFQDYGEAVFVIKTDGREAYRSKLIRGSMQPDYKINLTGVKTLELIVEKPHPSNGGNWALWLDPTLFRNP